MPSVVKLLERLARRDELIESLSAELGAVQVRIAELEARLGQTSRTPRSRRARMGWQPAPKSLRKRGDYPRTLSGAAPALRGHLQRRLAVKELQRVN